jgi:hypothetical protein
LPLAVVSRIFFVPLFTEVATISDFFYAMTPHGKRTLILATMLYLHSGKLWISFCFSEQALRGRTPMIVSSLT